MIKKELLSRVSRRTWAGVVMLVAAGMALTCHAPTANVGTQTKVGSELERGKQAGQGTALNVKLSPAGADLLREVEKAFGKSVKRVAIPPSTPDEAGAADVEADGTPVISLNPAAGEREEVVIHELFHLKLYAEGYHRVIFMPGPDVNKEGLDVISGTVLRPHVVSQIEHAIFFPRMRQMNLDPTFDQRAYWGQQLERPAPPGAPAELKRVMALYYFKAATQMDDPALLKRIADYYTRNNLGEALELGRRLEASYRQAEPVTPAKALEVVVAVCNLWLEGSLRCAVSASGPERHGEILLPVAYVQVSKPG